MQAPVTLSRRSMLTARNNRAAIWMMLVSETVFFIAFFTAYFYLRGGLSTWGPPGGQQLSLLVPGINTALLLLSAGTMHIAYRAIRHDQQKRFEDLLLITMLLGAGFIIGQIYEFSTIGFSLRDGAFASSFLLMIGVHAMHVAIGVIIFIIVHLRATLGQFHAQRAVPVEMCTLYWYFVALVWVALFAVLYLL
jgi:cytochrome c oxidase subunit 3